MTSERKTNILYIGIIALTWLFASIYTFDKKADLNGDNFYYYLVATSLSEGHGYSTPWTGEYTPSSTYPPGYPMLMAPLRMLTDSIVAQKWMNELFVLASLLLLFFTLLRLKVAPSLSFVAALSGALLPRLLHFSTMMMAESSALLSSMAALYFLARLDGERTGRFSELKSRWFYLMLLAILLSYHIRTQGVALLAAVCLYFLVRGRWSALLGTIGGFVLGCLPWTIRNNVHGLTANRYLDMVMVANPWRPEEGAITIPEFISRFFETAKMLLFNAIPSCVTPFLKVDADNPTYSLWIFIAGAAVLVLIAAGCIRLGRTGWVVGGYIAATVGVISSFSTPSGSRYLTAILPFISAMEMIGLCHLLTLALRTGWKKAVFPALLLIPLLLTARPGLEEQHRMANAPYPRSYQHFFEISKMLSKAPNGSVVCSRKAQMSYFYSGQPSCGYLYSSDREAVIKRMIKDNVDYVILDNLGYSSTSLYLYPAIMQYPSLFRVIASKKETGTYLLSFDRAAAGAEFNH